MFWVNKLQFIPTKCCILVAYRRGVLHTPLMMVGCVQLTSFRSLRLINFAQVAPMECCKMIVFIMLMLGKL